ncbi:MAG: hypothetical protein SPG07_09015, partial [Coriobacteriales bacterium]|nr:hypothetical protein [Coriobacteriales bacterium]
MPCAIRTSLGSDEAFRGLTGASARSVSDIVRILLRLPGGYVAGEETRPALVIDSFSARKLARETRWSGYRYIQIVHELNRIAMYLLNLSAPALEPEQKRQIIGMQFWKEYFAGLPEYVPVLVVLTGFVDPTIDHFNRFVHRGLLSFSCCIWEPNIECFRVQCRLWRAGMPTCGLRRRMRPRKGEWHPAP